MSSAEENRPAPVPALLATSHITKGVLEREKTRMRHLLRRHFTAKEVSSIGQAADSGPRAVMLGTSIAIGKASDYIMEYAEDADMLAGPGWAIARNGALGSLATAFVVPFRDLGEYAKAFGKLLKPPTEAQIFVVLVNRDTGDVADCVELRDK